MGLARLKIYPTIPASDMKRAKKFYQDKLGFMPSGENSAGVIYDMSHGTGFLLFPSKRAGSNPMTYAAWYTTDIETEVKELKDRGGVFEEYDTPSYKTIDG